jgi:membrane AbrB-like protein
MTARSDITGWRQPSTWRTPAQWIGLLALSVLISVLWGATGLPAALLLGPMIAGIVCGVYGVRLQVPRIPFVGAQAVIGVMVSAAVTPAIIAMLRSHVALFTLVIGATLLGAAFIGWVISRLGLIPGATAVYGTSPGAANAMVLLSEAEGADARLVAFMQYSRVLLVALAAAVVAHIWANGAAAHPPGAPWLAPVDWANLAAIAVLAGLSQQLARLIKLQAWALLGPMIVLSTIHAAGWISIDLPRWLLTAAYALIGWQIGLAFRRETLLHARRALPIVAAAAVCLMAFCGLLAWSLTRLAHVDALTAYLATSPGGLDSIAIIAASAPQVDLPFVLALQAVRLLLVIGLAPLITKLVVRFSPHLQKASPLSNIESP